MNLNVIKECNLCKKKLNVPTKLECGDIFCFMCIKTYVIDHGQNCPNCGKLIQNNLCEYVTDINVTTTLFRWAFSGVFNDGWWCYDDNTNMYIEKIYHDYLKRTSQTDKLKNAVTEYTKTIIKLESKDKSDSDKTKSHKNTYVKETDGKFYDFVQLSDESDTILEAKKTNDVIDYIISVGSNKYLLDFDHMKQISKRDPDKKRSILRISIPENVNTINYLRDNYKVKGIVGIKFIKN